MNRPQPNQPKPEPRHHPARLLVYGSMGAAAVIIAVLLVINLWLFGHHRAWWADDGTAPHNPIESRPIGLSLQPSSGPIIVHRGENAPPNWDRLLYGDNQALANLFSHPAWQTLIICASWPLPSLPSSPLPLANTSSITTAEALATPAVAAALYEWNNRLLALPISRPNTQGHWYRLILHQAQETNDERVGSAPHSWRYPLHLWAQLWMHALAHHPDMASPTQAGQAVPSTLSLVFSQESSAQELAALLTRWRHPPISDNALTVSAINPPSAHPLKFWFYRAKWADYQRELALFPFWRERQPCTD